MAIMDRMKNAWNAFTSRDPTELDLPVGGYISSVQPSRPRLSFGNNKTIISSVYTQIAVDCSSIDVKHVRVGEDNKYKETIHSSLNYALTMEANLDQSGPDLIRDYVLTLLDAGCVALVPTRTDVNPATTDSYQVEEIRVGKILEWFPKHVRVELYNPILGTRTQMVLEKRIVVIVENPFYNIMNEPNSTAKRLNRVLSQLDLFNSNVDPNKLDLIIQTPYSLKNNAAEARAKKRRKQIEQQLVDSKLGIAFTDSTEKIIQLNRSLENNLWEQAKDLTEELFNQLGFSMAIFNGTADEQTMLNYQNRTIEPIMSALVKNMQRKWITKTAQTQGQAIRFFKDPFKLVPVAKIAEIADKFTRNEIMTSNEIRAVVGMEPSNDPKANKLINSNLNHEKNSGYENESNEENSK